MGDLPGRKGGPERPHHHRTTGRRLESYNTGVQSNLYRSPLHRGESLDLSPEDVEQMELEEGEIVRISSRRGSVVAPVRLDPGLRPGLVFMTMHFPDEVDTNVLTIDATSRVIGVVSEADLLRKIEYAGAEEPRLFDSRSRRVPAAGRCKICN